ncbi:hypothetical protein ACYOEI_01710, partial [Singulisphaera rosea]
LVAVDVAVVAIEGVMAATVGLAWMVATGPALGIIETLLRTIRGSTTWRSGTRRVALRDVVRWRV